MSSILGTFFALVLTLENLNDKPTVQTIQNGNNEALSSICVTEKDA